MEDLFGKVKPLLLFMYFAQASINTWNIYGNVIQPYNVTKERMTSLTYAVVVYSEFFLLHLYIMRTVVPFTGTSARRFTMIVASFSMVRFVQYLHPALFLRNIRRQKEALGNFMVIIPRRH